MKMLALIFLVLLMAVGVYVWKTEVGDDEIFILPSGYKGVVYIFYNQENGQPVIYERGKRLYKIPQDGILKTQSSPNPGWQAFGEYYYEEHGKWTEVPYVIDGRDIESGKVQVCCDSTGRSGRDPKDPSVEFKEFYVGTKEDIQKAMENRERINPIDLLN